MLGIFLLLFVFPFSFEAKCVYKLKASQNEICFSYTFVTCDKKTFWPKNEAYFWHREWTSFKTWKVGIFISKCFKSRFRVETWTPVSRLILITCELLSRVTVLCCGAHVLKALHRDWNSVVAVLEMWRLLPLFQHILWWQICCTVPAVSVFYLYLALSVHQPPHGASLAVGTEQYHVGTDKSLSGEAQP